MEEDIFKSGFVTVAGKPNVGKSTLINALMGQKVVIVSEKPQTTRNRINCVLTEDNYQIVFVDTPGIHKPLRKIGEYMYNIAVHALEGVDLILFVTDVTEGGLTPCYWRINKEILLFHKNGFGIKKIIIIRKGSTKFIRCHIIQRTVWS